MRTELKASLRVALAVSLGAGGLGGCGDEASKPADAAQDDTLDPAGSGDDAQDGNGDGSDGGANEDGGTDDGAMPVDEPLSAADVRFYLKRIAPTFAGRSLSYAETQQIEADGEAAIFPIVEGWTSEPGFSDAVRYFVQTQLHASGNNGTIDFELPGNLAAEIAGLGLPWTTILTADYCVDGAGEHIECDTGAPYAAGVLSTRAYLSATKGHFNLSRARLMLESFACRKYPMETNIQIPLEKEVLIPMFRAESAEEQEVEEAIGGFGNGIGCYFCHSQFGAHAQLFVKYDGDGLFQATATGQQDTTPGAELGNSINGLYTSHMNDPVAAASEATQMFGESVSGLREAVDVMADSRHFTECTVKNLIAGSFGLLAGASPDVDDALLAALADDVTAVDDDPTIAQYVIEIFTDKRVVDTVVATLHAEGME